MRRVWNKNVAAGVILGALAAAISLNLRRLAIAPSNWFERWLEAIAFTLVVPGFLVDFFLARRGYNLPASVLAAINFVFWLGFAWLFGVLVDKLRRQLRQLGSHF